MKRLFIVCLFFAGLSLSQHVLALSISADARGIRSHVNFWGFKFNSGSGYIKSISFDVSQVGDHTHFNLSRKSNYKLGNLISVKDSNIEREMSVPYLDNDGRPQSNKYKKLTLKFTRNSCGAGCSVRFKAVTNETNPNGADHAGTSIRVVFWDDNAYQGALAAVAGSSPSRSSLTITSMPAANPVPLPAAAWLFLSALGMGGLVSMRRE